MNSLTQEKAQQQASYNHVYISGITTDTVSSPSELEQLYNFLRNEVLRTGNEVEEIYHLIDKLYDIPVSDIGIDNPVNDSNKIIPQFREEVLKLQKINHTLQSLRSHLQTIIG